MRVAKDPLTGGLPAVATLVVFGVWLARGWTPAAWPAILGWLALFVVLFAFGPLLLRRLGENGMIERSTIVAGVLLFAIAPIIAREPATESPALIFLTGAALLCAVAASSFRTGRHGDWITGAVAIVVAQEFWTFRYLAPETFRAAMLLYCGFALLTLAIAALGRRRHGDRWTIGSYLALGAFFFLLVAASEARITNPGPLLLTALAITLLASSVAALHLRRPSLHLLSILGAFAVLIVWQSARGGEESLAAPAWAAVGVTAFAILWIAAARREVAGPHEAAIGEAPLAAWTATAIVAILFLQGITSGGAAAAMHIDARAIGAILFSATLAFLALTFLARWHAVALVAVVTSAISTLLFGGVLQPEPPTWLPFSVAAAQYALFTLYPLALGRRSGRELAPALVAVAAAVPFFFFARDAMKDWELENVIGLLPVALGLVLLALLRRNVTLEREAGEEVLGRRALVAGAALAFLTAAIPLQLDKEWITVGWALEAAALAWLFGRIRHRGLLAWSAGLFAVVFIRLVFNPAVFSYHPRSATAILNWYFYRYAVAAAAFYAGARLLRRLVGEARVERKLPKALASGGTVLLFLLLNIEIADFYSTGATLTFDFFRAGLAQELTYTLGWALFAIAMLVAGIIGASRERPHRGDHSSLAHRLQMLPLRPRAPRRPLSRRLVRRPGDLARARRGAAAEIRVAPSGGRSAAMKYFLALLLLASSLGAAAAGWSRFRWRNVGTASRRATHRTRYPNAARSRRPSPPPSRSTSAHLVRPGWAVRRRPPLWARAFGNVGTASRRATQTNERPG